VTCAVSHFERDSLPHLSGKSGGCKSRTPKGTLEHRDSHCPVTTYLESLPATSKPHTRTKNGGPLGCNGPSRNSACRLPLARQGRRNSRGDDWWKARVHPAAPIPAKGGQGSPAFIVTAAACRRAPTSASLRVPAVPTAMVVVPSLGGCRVAWWKVEDPEAAFVPNESRNPAILRGFSRVEQDRKPLATPTFQHRRCGACGCHVLVWQPTGRAAGGCAGGQLSRQGNRITPQKGGSEPRVLHS